jgi:hypothetical protein
MYYFGFVSGVLVALMATTSTEGLVIGGLVTLLAVGIGVQRWVQRQGWWRDG